jgi:hypothetical protein
MKDCRRWKPVCGRGFVQRRTFEERLGGWVVNHPPAPLRQIMPMHGENKIRTKTSRTGLCGPTFEGDPT